MCYSIEMNDLTEIINGQYYNIFIYDIVQTKNNSVILNIDETISTDEITMTPYKKKTEHISFRTYWIPKDYMFQISLDDWEKTKYGFMQTIKYFDAETDAKTLKVAILSSIYFMKHFNLNHKDLYAPLFFDGYYPLENKIYLDNDDNNAVDLIYCVKNNV